LNFGYNGKATNKNTYCEGLYALPDVWSIVHDSSGSISGVFAAFSDVYRAYYILFRMFIERITCFSRLYRAYYMLFRMFIEGITRASGCVSSVLHPLPDVYRAYYMLFQIVSSVLHALPDVYRAYYLLFRMFIERTLLNIYRSWKYFGLYIVSYPCPMYA
jgi:hypothetical protein